MYQRAIDRIYDECGELLNLGRLLRLQGDAAAAGHFDKVMADCQAEQSCPRLAACQRATGAVAGAPAQPKAVGERPVNVFRLGDYRARNGKLLVNGGVVTEHLLSDDTVEDAEGNFVVRKHLRLDVVRTREASRMRSLLQYWESLGGEGRLPKLTDISPTRLRALGLLGFIHLVNVEADDPADFYLEVYGSQVTAEGGRSLAGVRIGDYKVRIYAEAVMADYNTVRMTGVPRYQKMGGVLNGSLRGYTRLLLPLSDDAKRVNRLLVGVRLEPLKVAD